MKRIIIVGLVAGLFTANVQAQTSKKAKVFNQTKEAVAMVINLEPIDIIAYATKKKTEISEHYNSNNIDIPQDLNISEGDSTRKTDTTEIKVGKTRIVVIGEPKIEKIYMEKDSTGDYEDDKNSKWDSKNTKNNNGELEFSIGYNGLLDNGSTSLSPANRALDLRNGKSIHVNLTYNHYFNIYRENVRISAGLGLDWNNYRLSGDSSFRKGQPTLTAFRDSVNGQAVMYSKNKLLARYVTLPVMLHFATNENKNGKSLAASGGVELGYLINGRLKQVSEEKGKQKINDTFNLNELRYGFIGRVSYGGVGIYGKYYPQSTFNKGEGPDLNTFVLGLTFGLE